MIKMHLTVAVLVSVGSLASLAMTQDAMAQDKQGEALGSEISAQCAHRRVMAPNLRDGCGPKLRGDAQLGYRRGLFGYGQGQLGYGQGQPAYGQGQPGYGQDELGYRQAQPGYGQDQLGYRQAQPGYGQDQPGYRQAQPGYGQGQPGYWQGQPGYWQGQPGYEQGQPGYGQGGASASISDQRDEEQPKVQREQPQTSALPKVAANPAPKAKKASAPPRLDAQKEQQLYQEFLEWRNWRLFNEHTP
jgi:hypothetical protein